MKIRLALAFLLAAARPAYADDRALLRDYAFLICISAAYAAGPPEFRAAGEVFGGQAWLFVENTDAGPDTFAALHAAAQAFGAARHGGNPTIACAKWRNGPELGKLVDAAEQE